MTCIYRSGCTEEGLVFLGGYCEKHYRYVEDDLERETRDRYDREERIRRLSDEG